MRSALQVERMLIWQLDASQMDFELNGGEIIVRVALDDGFSARREVVELAGGGECRGANPVERIVGRTSHHICIDRREVNDVSVRAVMNASGR